MKKYAIGLMSGTSLDGIDAALVTIAGCGLTTHVTLEAFITQPFDPEIKATINDCLSPAHSDVQKICQLNFQLGYAFAKACFAVCEKVGIPMEAVDYIASHGQTIFHDPFGKMPSTLQIGEAAVIAYETNKTVVSNFRPMDMAAGGQGAPLVPYVDYLLFGGTQHSIGLLNWGGIGNITVIPAQSSHTAESSVSAFDTGPGNMVIDELTRLFYNEPYDKDGAIAQTGHVDETILNDMLAHPYFLLPPPKSTGREMFGADYVKALLSRYSDRQPQDWIATATLFTAKTVELGYRRFVENKTPLETIIISGGGAYNKTLLQYLKKRLPEVAIKTQEDIGFSSEAKEAIAFAILGNETLHHRAGNLPSATGAKRPVILGSITPKP